jgi:hypothetical protein
MTAKPQMPPQSAAKVHQPTCALASSFAKFLGNTKCDCTPVTPAEYAKLVDAILKSASGRKD